MIQAIARYADLTPVTQNSTSARRMNTADVVEDVTAVKNMNKSRQVRDTTSPLCPSRGGRETEVPQSKAMLWDSCTKPGRDVSGAGVALWF